MLALASGSLLRLFARANLPALPAKIDSKPMQQNPGSSTHGDLLQSISPGRSANQGVLENALPSAVSPASGHPLFPSEGPGSGIFGNSAERGLTALGERRILGPSKKVPIGNQVLPSCWLAMRAPSTPQGGAVGTGLLLVVGSRSPGGELPRGDQTSALTRRRAASGLPVASQPTNGE